MREIKAIKGCLVPHVSTTSITTRILTKYSLEKRNKTEKAKSY